jgi:spermidine synthase
MSRPPVQFIAETLYQDWGQFFRDHEILHEEKSSEQHLLLINTKSYGKVLLLDGVVQVTERDNFVYHEMLTHVPVICHGSCKKVLVIGGGDGGMAKELLKYQDIEVTLVEIDQSVVDFTKQYLPEICEDAFNNDKLELKIADGAAYVQETSDRFDVIIVDSTDPAGPGEVLFTKEFYTNCKRILNPEGILVTQNGIPFTQADELRQSVTYFKELFTIGTCYVGTVPIYIGGEMAFGFATDNQTALSVSEAEIAERFLKTGITTNYYTPKLHNAAFALPRYIEKIIE